MIRFLQNLDNVNVDATKKAKVDTKRGMFVTTDDSDGTFAPAVDLASANGIAVRDTIVDENVAQGFPISEYSEIQNLIKKDTLAGVRVWFKGERFSTDQYDTTMTEDQTKAGKYLTVANGILVTSATATEIVSLGIMSDAGNTVLGCKFV